MRFESNNVIRFITPTEHRDILFGLDSDGKTMHYISEVRVENPFTRNNHKVAFQLTAEEDEFESLLQSNRLYRNQYWHRLNLDAFRKSRNKSQLADDNIVKMVDMISTVHKNGASFEAHLSFSTFGWLQAERVADGEIMLDQLSDKHRLRLTLGIFPQA